MILENFFGKFEVFGVGSGMLNHVAHGPRFLY